MLLRHEDLHALHSLLIDEGALSFLENFVIGPSLQLKEVTLWNPTFEKPQRIEVFGHA